MKSYFKYFFVILLVIVAYLSFLVIKPLITAIVFGAVVAYVFYPLFNWLNKYCKNANIRAFAVSIIIILLFSIPTLILINNTADEARYFYVRAKQALISGNLLGIECVNADSMSCTALKTVKSWLTNPTVRGFLEEGISKFSTFILSNASQVIFSLPKIMLNLFVAFFVSFYALIDGKKWVHKAKSLLPIAQTFQREVFSKIDKITYAVVYGSLIVALIQGALGAVGFFIFGVGSPILWGIVMTIFALIPFVGTAVIWGPIALLTLLEGYLGGEQAMVMKGVGLLIYGTIVISGIDNLIKPKIIGAKAEVHPIVVLIGVIGGLSFLGFAGFIVGPLILALFLALLEIYEKEKAVILR